MDGGLNAHGGRGAPTVLCGAGAVPSQLRRPSSDALVEFVRGLTTIRRPLTLSSSPVRAQDNRACPTCYDDFLDQRCAASRAGRGRRLGPVIDRHARIGGDRADHHRAPGQPDLDGLGQRECRECDQRRGLVQALHRHPDLSGGAGRPDGHGRAGLARSTTPPPPPPSPPPRPPFRCAGIAGAAVATAEHHCRTRRARLGPRPRPGERVSHDGSGPPRSAQPSAAAQFIARPRPRIHWPARSSRTASDHQRRHLTDQAEASDHASGPPRPPPRRPRRHREDQAEQPRSPRRSPPPS